MTNNAELSGVEPLTRFADYLDEHGRNIPDSVAMVFEGDRVTYAELKRRVDEFARALLARGVRKGDRVAMLCTSRSEFWVCVLATVRIGAIWVGLNPKYTLRECRYVLDDAGPRVLIAITRVDGSDVVELIRELAECDSSLEHVVVIGAECPFATTYEDFLAEGSEVSEDYYLTVRDAVASDDIALIVYTSGSSGSPKGAALTHYGLSFGATMQASHFGVTRPSCVVNFPINHVACVADTCATTYVKGGKIVFQERFEPAATLAAVAAERCSIWGGVPTMILMMIDDPTYPETDMSSVEIVIWGGAAMPASVVKRLQALDVRLMTVYGMTETSCNTTFTGANADLDCLTETVGIPDPACECRIVSESGSPREDDTPGELQFRGPYLMREYWGRPDATREAFTPDGWLRTGDIAYWRPDGNIRLVGRLSDMFKSGGYNVYPREIETVLEQLPSVAMAAVIGVADELFQEVGLAYVQPAPGSTVDEDELRDWCRTSLANYKVPKQFIVAHELPLLPVGKVDKQALMEARLETM